MSDSATSTDTHTAGTTEAGLDQQQLPEQSSSRAESAADPKASGKQEPEDHTPVVAPSAESIRQGIMEASLKRTSLPIDAAYVLAFTGQCRLLV